MEITIRKMKKGDWVEMQRLNTEVFESDAQHVSDLDCDWPKSETAIQYYKSVAEGSKGVGFLAVVDDIPIGYIALSQKKVSYRTEPYVEIDNMGVTPQYRSKGIGVLLVTQAKKWALEQGVPKLYVSAFAGNNQGISFYKKCGFEEVAVDFELQL